MFFQQLSFAESIPHTNDTFIKYLINNTLSEIILSQNTLSKNSSDNSEKAAAEFLRSIADPETESERRKWQFYADINSSFDYQDFELSKTEVTTLSFQPYIYNGNWLLSLNLPWKSIDGDAIIYPNGRDITALCEQVRDSIDGLIADGNQILARRLSNRIDGVCVSNQDRESGLADISLSISYERALGQTGSSYLDLSSYLKWDNGDIDKRIGSGTRELWNQISLSKTAGNFYASLHFGHTALIGGDFEEFYDNYFDAAIKLKKKINQYLALGTSLNWLEASNDFGDDELSIDANLQLYLDRRWYFSLRTTHYIETSSSIEQSYNGSLSYSF